jgi:hypothetical protein
MAQSGLSESALKKLFKEALTETLQEQGEVLHDVFAEVLEDIAFAEAMRQGQQTEQVAREEIFRSLEGNGPRPYSARVLKRDSLVVECNEVAICSDDSR